LSYKKFVNVKTKCHIYQKHNKLIKNGQNYHRGLLLISAGAIEGHVEGNAHGKVTKGVLFLHDNAMSHRALATQKKLAYSSLKCLKHTYILVIVNSDLLQYNVCMLPSAAKLITV
jgi:hypothetical protein